MAAWLGKPLAHMVAASLVASAPGAAASPTQDSPAVFRIGMVAPPGEDFSRIERAFAGALGVKVEIVIASGYAELIEDQIGRRVDYAVYSAPAYAAASIRCECVRPLAAPLGPDGAIGLHSVLILRREAGGNGLARIAVGPDDSLATRLAPLALWEEADRARAQGLLVEAPNAGEAENLFLRGAVDGFFGWIPGPDDGEGPASEATVGSMARLQAAGLDGADYEMGWVSRMLPHGPHAVRDDMPEERVASLLAALLREGGFAAVSQDDYNPVVKALRTLDEPGG